MTVFLYAYNKADGSPAWQERLSVRIVGGPAVSGNLALVGTGAAGSTDGSQSGLHAVDVVEGDPVWEYGSPGPIWSSPTVKDGVAYFGSLDHYVYAVNIEDGGEKWRYRLGGSVASGIAAHDDMVIFGGFDSTLYALDADTGNLKWKFPDATRWYWATPLVYDGVVYAPSLDGVLYALDAATGQAGVEVRQRRPACGRSGGRQRPDSAANRRRRRLEDSPAGEEWQRIGGLQNRRGYPNFPQGVRRPDILRFNRSHYNGPENKA